MGGTVRRRKLSRQKKFALAAAVVGVGGGALVIALWPEIQRLRVRGLITSGKPTVKSKGVPSAAYTKGTPQNIALNRAMDAWYERNPDKPFVNDDGSLNILPGYEIPPG
jgi:hypothetical protein